MENTTKALLMAAGILIAIMVVSLLVITFNQISYYQQSKQISMTEEQIKIFNSQYESYNRDNVTGFELVSIINKVIDFNANNAVDTEKEFNNTDKAYEKMYISFTLKNTGTLFTQKTYDSESSDDWKNKKTNTSLTKIIDDMNTLEKTYGGANIMSKFAAMTSYDPTTDEGREKIDVAAGKRITNLPSVEEVKKYQEYIEFKRGNFKCTKIEYNSQTGRVTKLYFEQK